MKSYISIKNLHKSFGQKKVLEGVNFEINKGDSLVIIGGSGSGKSVFIKNLAGLIAPDSGSIKIADVEINQISHKDYQNLTKSFGFLFQGGALFDSLTIWENIAFSLINNNLKTSKQCKDIAHEKILKVGLSSDVANLYPAQLSGGMQKRVALARAIANDPEIIFFDEPTAGLDPVMSNVINNLIVQCVKDLNATAITITHDMHSAKLIAQRVGMLYQGKIIWEGEISHLFSSGNDLVSQFVNGNIQGPLIL